MAYTNTGNCNNVDKSATNWYARTISTQALSCIPDQFKNIPTFRELRFKHRNSFCSTVNANWTKEAPATVLTLGFYDDPSSNLKPPMYTFIHGPKNHDIGFFYIKPDLSVQHVQWSEFKHVNVEEPLCDLGKHSLSERTSYNRMRAMILYYFLAAGNIEKLGNYSNLWRDFEIACKWIANKGSRPKPRVIVPKQDTGPITDASAHKKRAGDKEIQPAPAKIKRRDYSDKGMQPLAIISRPSNPEQPLIQISLEARLKASEAANAQQRLEIDTRTRSLERYQKKVEENHQLQAKVTELTDEVNRVKNEAEYSKNAYRGIQVECEKLNFQHTDALNDAESLREQLQKSQLHCTEIEKRSKVLEVELGRLKQKMRDARDALDDSAL